MDLSQILTAANVNPLRADQFIQGGWTAEHFALLADSSEKFEEAIKEVFSDVMPPLERAALKLACKRCQASPVVDTAATAPDGARPPARWQVHGRRRLLQN